MEWIALFKKELEAYKETGTYKFYVVSMNKCSNCENVEKCIDMLSTTLEKVPLVPEGMDDALKDPFPVVLGSETAVARYPHFEPGCGWTDEHVVTGGMRLGSDIQWIFVPSDKVETMKKYVEGQNLNLRIATIDELKSVQKLYHLASRYFWNAARSPADSLKNIGK
jgi:hypothetical protein